MNVSRNAFDDMAAKDRRVSPTHIFQWGDALIVPFDNPHKPLGCNELPEQERQETSRFFFDAGKKCQADVA